MQYIYIYKFYTVSVFDITTHHTYILSLNISTIIIIITYYLKSLFLCLELQDSQTLMMIEKKASLLKLKELDHSRKQMTDLKGKLKVTSTLSSHCKNECVILTLIWLHQFQFLLTLYKSIMLLSCIAR